MDLFEFSKTNTQKKEETDIQPAQERVLTVSEITFEIKQLITSHFNSKSSFWIKGEISGFKGKNQSGHMYFKMKDENAVMNCVFFKFQNSKSKVELKEGLSVFVRGKIDVYEKNGNYQMIIDEVRADGAGDLYLKFEQLKKKLQEEGLFDPEHKKPLPRFPKTIAVITSSTGAVIRDIIHVVRNRYPIIKILLFSVKVQGEGAADEIAKAIENVHRLDEKVDVMIVCRGGGSIEDLWAFNEEKVARAIYAATIPVVSAVGHQTDFTISDFVADVRAATPSHAVEMITPNLIELRSGIEQTIKQIMREVILRKDLCREKLIRFLRAPVLVNPRNLVYQKQQRFDFAFERFCNLMDQSGLTRRAKLDQLRDRFHLCLENGLKKERMILEKAASNLMLVNPKSVLSRGFSIVEKKNKQIVRSANQVDIKEHVVVHLHEGTIECEVLKH